MRNHKVYKRFIGNGMISYEEFSMNINNFNI